MFVSNKNKAVFVAVTKTSTRSIYVTMKENYAGHLYREHCKIIPKQYIDYTSFIVKRNPYDRFISMWWSTTQRNRDRYNFIKNSGGKTTDHLINWMMETKSKSVLLALQKEWHVKNRIDYVLDFENLDADFSKLPFVKKPIILPFANRTINVRNEWHTYYDQNLLDKVNRYYKEDFDFLGYEMYTNIDDLKKSA